MSTVTPAAATPRRSSASVGSVSAKDKYDAGSKALQNYSTLTKDLRVLAFQILAATVVGLAIVVTNLAKSESPTQIGAEQGRTRQVETGELMFGISFCIFLFALALFAVNTHYATAFRFIRDAMVRLEGRDGPWIAHKKARRGMRDEVAYAAPFLTLAVIAILGMWHSGSVFGGLSGRTCAVFAGVFAILGLVWWWNWMNGLHKKSRDAQWVDAEVGSADSTTADGPDNGRDLTPG